MSSLELDLFIVVSRPVNRGVNIESLADFLDRIGGAAYLNFIRARGKLFIAIKASAWDSFITGHRKLTPFDALRGVVTFARHSVPFLFIVNV